MIEGYIKKFEAAVASKNINPSTVYKIDLGDGKVHSSTGAELIETAAAYLELLEAKKSGDKKRLEEAVIRISKIPNLS